MKIDLSHYVGKTVKVRYSSGDEAFGIVTVRQYLPRKHCYMLVDKNQNRITDHYASGKCYYFTGSYDIVQIEPITTEKTMDKLDLMTNLFNAKDAHKLSSLSDPNQLIKIILAEIEEVARNGKWEYITRSYGFGESVLYDIENNYPTKIKEVLNMLHDLGFTAKIITNENQFVDIFLQVTWNT